MEAYVGDWLGLLVRWVHLITGIAWIGASFYFVWLDNSLTPPARRQDADDGVGGELWAIHGGGFYHVQKFRVAPQALPPALHWFKWEAYSTWLSGFALFVIVYYANARTYMIDPAVADLAPWQAVAISVGMLVLSWVFYDQLCKRLGLERERAIGFAMVVFVAASAFVLSKLFAGRAMFLQIGAMLGTIMAANVLFVIIPSQRELVLAKERGEPPDPIHGQRGKQRSVHNNYFTLPVLLTMIGNHYPMTFGHAHAWAVLVAMLLLAAYVRHFFNLRHKGRTVWAIPLTAAAAALLLAIAIAPARPDPSRAPPFAQVERIVVQRCASCHADKPTHPGFAIAPKGVVLDTPDRIVAGARQIFEQSVATRAMPIGNLTAMTDDERAQVGAWIAAGTPR
jgi:uncharacterized membrane protein